MDLANLPAGPAALGGAAIAAIASFVVQGIVLWRTRRAQVKDAKFKVAGEFLSRAQEICTEYRMLDVNYREFDLRFSQEELRERADKAFDRGLDAWLRYRGAHAQVMIDPPRKKVREAAMAVNDALDRWVNAIDAKHFGLTVEDYEAKYGKLYGYDKPAGTIEDRDKAVQDALAAYQEAAQR